MRNLAYELHLYCPSTTLREAMSMTASDAKQLFDSKAYQRWQEREGTDSKNIVEVINRLNSVIQAVGNVTKSIGALGRFRRG